MIREAKAVWRGTGRAGNGHLSTDPGPCAASVKRADEESRAAQGLVYFFTLAKKITNNSKRELDRFSYPSKMVVDYCYLTHEERQNVADEPKG